VPVYVEGIISVQMTFGSFFTPYLIGMNEPIHMSKIRFIGSTWNRTKSPFDQEPAD
jgi:hypothetical protein